MVNVPTVSFNPGSVPVPPERPSRFARGTGMCFGIEGDLTPSVNQWLDFPMRIPASAGCRWGSGAGAGSALAKSPTVIDGIRPRKSGSHQIPGWRGPDSNHRSRESAWMPLGSRFREVEARLKSHGIDYIGPIVQLPGLLGIYFYAPPSRQRR